MFRFLAVPVIALSLINTLASLNHGDGGKLIFFNIQFFILCLPSFWLHVLQPIIFMVIAPTNVPSEMAGTANVGEIACRSYLKYLLDEYIIQPFISENMLSILLIPAFVGLGLAVLPECEIMINILI